MESLWKKLAILMDMECYDAKILIVKYCRCLQNTQPHLFSGVISFFFKQITTTSDWSFCGACCAIRLTRESHSRSVPSCIHARKKQHHQPTLHRAMIITDFTPFPIHLGVYNALHTGGLK